MRLALLVALLFAGALSAQDAVDISDTRRLMFVADATEPFIDVVDLVDEEVVFRIETAHVVDDLVATPYAPVLVYTSIERRLVSIYDLRNQVLAREVELSVVPRHLVLDTTGSRIAFTDSRDGGFVLFSPLSGEPLFELAGLPATGDVLFDPNEVDIYYTNDATGSIGTIDMNQRRYAEIELTDVPNAALSSPSRSLDGRYVYVANATTGEVYSLNAFSRVVYRTFDTDAAPARPYTTPEGVFLYMMDAESGRFVSVEQNRFETYADIDVGMGVNLVTVGRFDRMNLLASTSGREFVFYDNLERAVVGRGEFEHTPLDALGSVDGRKAYVAFRDSAEVAIVDLESRAVRLVEAGATGAGAFAVGLTNNVCH